MISYGVWCAFRTIWMFSLRLHTHTTKWAEEKKPIQFTYVWSDTVRHDWILGDFSNDHIIHLDDMDMSAQAFKFDLFHAPSFYCILVHSNEHQFIHFASDGVCPRENNENSIETKTAAKKDHSQKFWKSSVIKQLYS